MTHADILAPRFEAPRLSGTWKLPAGRAMTLQPRETGRLKVAHGQLWATYDGPHRGALNDWGDHVIGTGEELELHGGQRLVLEPWDCDVPAYFSWEPLEALQAEAPLVIAQPIADLRFALALAARAFGQLSVALGTLLAQRILGCTRRETFHDEVCRNQPAVG